MNFDWIHRILLFLCLCRAANMTSCGERRLVIVEVNGTASVQCPNLTGKPKEEINYQLYFEKVLVVTHKYDSGHVHNATENISNGWRLEVNKTNHMVKYVRSGMTAELTGFYTCKAQQAYPPPLPAISENMTFVLVKAYQCLEKAPEYVSVWVWKLAFWITLAYGLAATVIGLVSYLRKKREEGSQSDYMNTRPRAPPMVIKKKQGVQLPVRMGRY